MTKLTDYHASLIDDFQELLEFGQDIYDLANNKPTKTKKRIFLMHAMAATQHCSGAILKLTKPPNIYDQASEILIRTLIENLINTTYIFSIRGNKNLENFALNSDISFKSFLKKYVALMKKYPQWNIKLLNQYSINDLEKKAKELNQEIALYKQKGFKENTLIDRVIIIDKELSRQKILNQNNSLEYYYIQFYKYYSDPSHLSIDGLSRFKKDNSFYINGKLNDLDRIIPIAHSLYFETLKLFAQKFQIYSRIEFSKYNFNNKNPT